MDKEGELLFEGLRHFANYMHQMSYDTDDNKPVSDACKVVAHIADAVKAAAEELEAAEPDKK